MGTLAVVEIPGRSGLPKDKIVNTWAIAETEGLDQLATAPGYFDWISSFYTGVDAGLGSAIGALLAPGLSRTAMGCSIKFYNLRGHLDGTPHGSPYYVENFTLPAAEYAEGYPDEVALCLTMEATDRALQFVEVPDGVDPGAAPDRPRQRYTGRIYVGPFAYGAKTKFTDAQGYSRPPAALLTGMRTMAKAVADGIDGLVPLDEAAIGVWSRANRAIRGVEFFRTDDAWDTQRRRGVQPANVARTRVTDLVPEVELAA